MSAVDQQAALEALINHRRAVHGQLDADHGAQDANLLDPGAARAQSLEALAEALADMSGALKQPVRLNALNGRQSRAAGDGVATEGGGVGAGLELVGDRGAGHQSAA